MSSLTLNQSTLLLRINPTAELNRKLIHRFCIIAETITYTESAMLSTKSQKKNGTQLSDMATKVSRASRRRRGCCEIDSNVANLFRSSSKPCSQLTNWTTNGKWCSRIVHRRTMDKVKDPLVSRGRNISIINFDGNSI